MAMRIRYRHARFEDFRWKRSAVGRAGGVLLSGLLAAVWGCGKSSPPPPAPKVEATVPPASAASKTPTPPAPKPMHLAELAPVVVWPASKAKVRVRLDRQGNEGPIHFEFQDVPEGIVASGVEIPAEASEGDVEIAASEKLGDSELKATLKVIAKLGPAPPAAPTGMAAGAKPSGAGPGSLPLLPGMMPGKPPQSTSGVPGALPTPPGAASSPSQAVQTLIVTVPKVQLPRFLPLTETVLQPGATATIELAVDRTAYNGPMDLQVENLPGKFTGKVGSLAADQKATKLHVTASQEVPDGKHSLRVFAKVYGRVVEVQVPLLVDRTPFRVQSFTVVNLKPGETKRIQVPVERRTYKGALRLEAADLPEGVKVKTVEVAPDQGVATLEFSAAPNTKELVRSAKVISTGGEKRREDPMIVRVSLGGKGFLPREVLENPNLQALLKRGSFGGRLTTEAKKALLDAYGGTAESEAAVLRGLQYLAAHQRDDGSWPLDAYWEGIEGCDCNSDANKDIVKSDVAGTAFGVLPFLGAGVNHKTAPRDPPELAAYKQTVFKALVFLAKRQTVSKEASKDGTLDGNMYAHALGTIALCEGFGLSGDERLKVPAQRAIKHIIQAQHKEGGWRYQPNQPGDMSAVGWQFLAIRSGQLAGLMIEKDPLVRASRFVDSCAAGPPEARKSRYAYMPPSEENPKPQATPSLTAAGLLTRQYLGWRKEMPDLVAGVRYLMENLPPESGTSLGPIYYYYYATQVLHHMEGGEFDLWNHRMREHLIRTQIRQGHKAGSWDPQGTDWGKQGGRLYATSMALLTLEVYYRHLPLYRTVFEEQKTVVE